MFINKNIPFCFNSNNDENLESEKKLINKKYECNYCNEIPLIKIKKGNNYLIDYVCKNNHKEIDITINDFFERCIDNNKKISFVYFDDNNKDINKIYEENDNNIKNMIEELDYNINILKNLNTLFNEIINEFQNCYKDNLNLLKLNKIILNSYSKENKRTIININNNVNQIDFNFLNLVVIKKKYLI